MQLLGGGLALVGQGLLLQPLVSCCKEKGVIIIAMIATSMNMAGFAGTAFYPHKWAIYVSCMPGLLSDLSFPAIAALKSINVSDKVRNMSYVLVRIAPDHAHDFDFHCRSKEGCKARSTVRGRCLLHWDLSSSRRCMLL